MPKKAPIGDDVDPVRSRLAEMAAAPVAPPSVAPPIPELKPSPKRAPVSSSRGGRVPQTVTQASVVHAEKKAPRTSTPRIMTVNRKIMVSPEEAVQIEETTQLISAAFGSKVSYSQVSRALWTVLAESEDAIKAGARRAPALRVPSKGDHFAMGEYETALGDFLAIAMKRS